MLSPFTLTDPGLEVETKSALHSPFNLTSRWPTLPIKFQRTGDL